MTETLECRRCGKPTQYNFCSQKCSKENNEAMAEGYDSQGNQTYASPEAIRGMLDKEEVTRLWHIARVALAGSASGRFERLQYVKREYIKAHPEWSAKPKTLWVSLDQLTRVF